MNTCLNVVSKEMTSIAEYFEKRVGKSAVYKMKRRGPSTEPWGTPNKIGTHEVLDSPETSYPPIYVGDEVVSWFQAVELTKDATTNNETVPANDKHLTNKKYVDDRDALKVSKAGDIMTGNLLLRVGSSHTIVLGCRDLNGNKTF